MNEIVVVTKPVQAERLEAERVVHLPTGGPECLKVVRDTEIALTEALTSTGKDFAHVEVKWTCTVIGITPTVPATHPLPGHGPGVR